ncbi:aldehyde dehydrogenase family protein [Frankia sp. AgB32]|uniref:aldehyde dehydrogenase family protein n=1 Tax=Frankia sp. AgB32 TaxID=631119 RepID=UPI00200FB282|nr:aldehyde dehydrogenase family protein [Frankia sp. AgB32]MCK9896356.1 aldehyde dehydrogenase family protein [Frankia sp. AgB32]
MELPSLQHIYIGGRWVTPATTATIEVENPATGRIIRQVPAGHTEDVDRAVAAARSISTEWSASSIEERISSLARLRTMLVESLEEMALIITRDVGSPLNFSRRAQAGLPLLVLDGYLDALRSDSGEERIGNSLVLREPAGVVAAITPWNYPLHQAIAKIGAALASGCTIVLKPSERAPLSAYLLTALIDRLDLPDGVFNLVPGDGRGAGAPLVVHPDVDVVSFTGSVTVGGAVAAAAARTGKKVCLELGGASTTLVLPDADLADAVEDAVGSALRNAGQSCTARRRLLVPASRLSDVVEAAGAMMARYTPGDPEDPNCRLGPLASAAQKERVLGFLRCAQASGAQQVLPAMDVPSSGHFVAPTLWTGVRPDSELVQEEIFGPVLSVLTYTSEDEAVEITNDTSYGLDVAVWSADTDRAIAVGRRLRVGQVEVNGGGFNPAAPFGGYKRSGVGRELGLYGIREFQEVKSLQLPV